jgi:hypothetical protein
MTQRQLNKLVKIKKILKAKQEEAIPEQIKDYVINGVKPKKESTLEIAQQLKDFHNNMIENRLFPSMPTDAWMAEHGTKSQDLDERGIDNEQAAKGTETPTD